MQDILVTNNPLVKEKILSGQLAKSVTLNFVLGGYRDVLIRVRDFVHNGHRLLTHPLSGSVKPNENPFKSVLISSASKPDTDADSVRIIESALTTFEKFLPKYKSIPDSILKDFMTVDFTLISSAF